MTSRTVTTEEMQILKSVKIPPRPQVLLNIAGEFRKDQPNVTDIAAFIMQDAAISGAVLQVINSAAYRRASKIESVEQAVMLLGLNRVYPLVKAVALRATMSINDDLTYFWEQQEDIGKTCILAAQLMDKPELSDQVYLLGLFHFSGVPVLCQVYEDYGEFMGRADQEGWENLIGDQRTRYNTSHASVGSLFAHKWALPRDMYHVIYNLHDVRNLYESKDIAKSALDYLTILKMARTAVICIDDNFSEFLEWANVLPQILAHYNVSETDMNDKLLDLRENMTLH